MIIKEIELNNFRIYKGQNNIYLAPVEDKNIFIVSGKNGFGKTTFLMSLVWCLYGKQMGEVDSLYQKEISEAGGYSKYITNSLNRMAKSEGETMFSVSITFAKINIPDLPCQEIKVTRSFDIVTSTTDQVEITIDGYENELTNEVGPEFFIRDFILPKEIAKFFFFDAEKIVTLAEVNTAEQRKSLSKAYSEVLGIKKYEDLKDQLEDYQLKLRQESASQKERQQLIDLEAEVKKRDLEIFDNLKSIEVTKDKILEKRKAVADIQEKLIRAGSVITVDELNRLLEEERVANEKLSVQQEELKESFEIIPFAIAGETFLQVSNQIDSETNYKKQRYQQENIKGTTNKVLNDLFNYPKPENLVIDHRVHEYYSSLFEKLIRKHFFADAQDMDVDYKSIHDFSEIEKNELNALLNNIKLSFKESFKRISGEVNQYKNELNTIRRKIRDAEANQEDPIIASLRQTKSSLESEILALESEKDSLISANGSKESEKIGFTKRIQEISRKLELSEANKAKDELAQRHISEVKEFIVRFKEEKKKSLEQQILKGLETLMHKKGFVKKVRVDIIGEDIDILLYNKRSEEIRKESLSKGEQQMYATALLRGLVEESDIDFPVFIDSPMQKFDEEHAINILKYFYPNISEQVVIFPLINKEMTEKEYNLLLKNISETYLIKNVHEDKSEFLPVKPDKFFDTYNQLYNVN